VRQWLERHDEFAIDVSGLNLLEDET